MFEHDTTAFTSQPLHPIPDANPSIQHNAPKPLRVLIVQICYPVDPVDENVRIVRITRKYETRNFKPRLSKWKRKEHSRTPVSEETKGRTETDVENSNGRAQG